MVLRAYPGKQGRSAQQVNLVHLAQQERMVLMAQQGRRAQIPLFLGHPGLRVQLDRPDLRDPQGLKEMSVRKVPQGLKGLKETPESSRLS